MIESFKQKRANKLDLQTQSVQILFHRAVSWLTRNYKIRAKVHRISGWYATFSDQVLFVESGIKGLQYFQEWLYIVHSVLQQAKT